MLYFVSRTYTAEDWSYAAASSDNKLYLNTSTYASHVDTVPFPTSIILESVSVRIQSYNMKFVNIEGNSNGTNPIIAIGAGIVNGEITLDVVNPNSIKIVPYLLLNSGIEDAIIGAPNALLSLSIIAQKA